MKLNFINICPNIHSNNTTCFLCVKKIKRVKKNEFKENKISVLYGNVKQNH